MGCFFGSLGQHGKRLCYLLDVIAADGAHGYAVVVVFPEDLFFWFWLVVEVVDYRERLSLRKMPLEPFMISKVPTNDTFFHLGSKRSSQFASSGNAIITMLVEARFSVIVTAPVSMNPCTNGNTLDLISAYLLRPLWFWQREGICCVEVLDDLWKASTWSFWSMLLVAFGATSSSPLWYWRKYLQASSY
ncbi:hypothetical protein ACLOJK_041009 [Asimina triloba]